MCGEIQSSRRLFRIRTGEYCYLYLHGNGAEPSKFNSIANERLSFFVQRLMEQSLSSISKLLESPASFAVIPNSYPHSVGLKTRATFFPVHRIANALSGICAMALAFALFA